MKLKILTLSAGLALAAGAALAADAPPAGADQRNEERIVIICEAGPGGPHGPHGPGGPTDMHGKLDPNNDGAISREEFRAAHDEMFAKLDRNNDGKLSGDEFPHGPGGPGGEVVEMRMDAPAGPGGERIELHLDGPGGPGGPGCHPGGPGDVVWTDHGPSGENVRIIRQGPGGPAGPDELDKNSDGKLSFEEFAAPMREHFNEADKNHNGFLDDDEMRGDHQFIFRRVESH